MATVPTVFSFAAGSVLTAAQLNTYLSQAVGFIIAPPLFVLRQTINQSLSSGIFASITFDTEDIDRDGGHSTTTNPSRYTAQTAGWYKVNGLGSVGGTTGATASTRRILQWALNTQGIAAGSTQVPPITGGTNPTAWLPPSREVFMNVGDFLELQIFEDDSGTRNTFASGGGGTAQPLFTGRWVST